MLMLVLVSVLAGQILALVLLIVIQSLSLAFSPFKDFFQLLLLILLA